MEGKQFGKAFERVKRVGRIKPLLVLAVTSFRFADMARRIGTNQLVSDAQFCGSFFKQRLLISLAV